MVKNTQKNWGKEAAKPIIGIVICGFITFFMLLLSLTAFIQYNEMEPMRESAVVIADGKILPENEGKLVFVSGRVTVGESIVSDTDFDVTVEAPYLARIVEMRQWMRSSSKNRNMGDLVIWSSELQPRRQEIGGEWYTNPTHIPFEGAVFHADAPFMLGEFELSQELLEKFLRLPDRRTIVSGLKQSGADKNGLELLNDNTYFYKSNFGPVIGDAFGTSLFGIGDVRIYFQIVDPSKLGEITVMAKQENGMLTKYSESISHISHLYDGIMNKDEVLAVEKSSDNIGAITAICITLIPAGFTALNIRKVTLIKRKYK